MDRALHLGEQQPKSRSIEVETGHGDGKQRHHLALPAGKYSKTRFRIIFAHKIVKIDPRALFHCCRGFYLCFVHSNSSFIVETLKVQYLDTFARAGGRGLYTSAWGGKADCSVCLFLPVLRKSKHRNKNPIPPAVPQQQAALQQMRGAVKIKFCSRRVLGDPASAWLCQYVSARRSLTTGKSSPLRRFRPIWRPLCGPLPP